MSDPAPPVDRARRRRLVTVLAAVALVVVVADQATKMWAVAELTGRGRVDVLGDAFGFRLVRNPGAAFSFATGATWVFTILASVVVVVIVRLSRKIGSAGWALVLGLLLGGALGNLLDRLFRQPGFARGHVVDFPELPRWPVFNIADSALVTAAVLIVLLGLRGIGLDGTREGDPKPAPEAAK